MTTEGDPVNRCPTCFCPFYLELHPDEGRMLNSPCLMCSCPFGPSLKGTGN